MGLEEMRDFIGVDSLAFLSVDGLYRAMGYRGRDNARPQFTDHCFTGDYPTRLTDQDGEPGSGNVAAQKRAEPALAFTNLHTTSYAAR